MAIADLDGEAAESAAKNLKEAGFEATATRTNVSEESDVERIVATSAELYGDIDILVNNAGIYPNIFVMNMETDDFTRVPNVNLLGVFLCTRLVAKHMIEHNHGGRIINITSIDALHPSSAGLAHYDASKHGVWGFTKNIALELAPHQIWVNAIAPGGIATPGVQQAQSGAQIPEGADMSKLLEAFLGRIPMARMGEPDDTGKVALFLASDCRRT